MSEASSSRPFTGAFIAATRRSAKTPVRHTAAFRRPTVRPRNNIVLALILHHRRWDNAAQALRYFMLRLDEAFKALLAPD